MARTAPHDRRTVCRDAHFADQPISSSPSVRSDGGTVSAAICSGALTAALLPRASPTRLDRIPRGQQVPTEARNKPLIPRFHPPVLEEFETGGLFFFVGASNLRKRYVAVSESLSVGRWGTGGAAWNTQ